MKKGAIVLTPFPFTDLSSTKRRPALIISSPRIAENDVIVAFISSKIITPIAETDYIIDINHPDFKYTGLKKSSILKMAKIVTVEKGILIGEIGQVSNSILKEIEKRLRIVFDL